MTINAELSMKYILLFIFCIIFVYPGISNCLVLFSCLAFRAAVLIQSHILRSLSKIHLHACRRFLKRPLLEPHNRLCPGLMVLCLSSPWVSCRDLLSPDPGVSFAFCLSQPSFFLYLPFFWVNFLLLVKHIFSSFLRKNAQDIHFLRPCMPKNAFTPASCLNAFGVWKSFSSGF